VVGEQAVGVRLGGHQAHLQVRQTGCNHRHRQAVAADRLEGDADRRQRRRVEVVHLVDQEQRARACRLRDLADLSQQVCQVLLGITRVRDARRGSSRAAASFVAPRRQALDQRLEALEIAVAPREHRWLASSARRVRVISLLHPRSLSRHF
jgi:hypothetical protein